jgi:hypothetical protein
VTTPPSKGLVVELYLIYFGLAQSFVDVEALFKTSLSSAPYKVVVDLNFVDLRSILSVFAE